MKKLVSMVLSLVLVFALASVASATAPEITLQLAEVHPEGYPTHLADVRFAELIAERTGGRIKVEVYGGGTLYAEETGAIEALQLGDLAFARVSASPVASYVPSINAIQMPYLYKNAAHMWGVLNGEIGQGMLGGIEAAADSGLVGLCYYDAGSRSFYTTKKVGSVADMAGLKIRVQNNQMMIRMVELLGAAGITGIGPGDVLSAITQGTIDGAENNWPTYQNMGDYEAAKYYVLDSHTRVPELLLASAEMWKGLSAEDQAIIRECAKETQEYEIEQWALKEKSSEEIVRAAGVEVTELTPEQYAEFQAKVAPLYDEFGAEYKDIIEAIRALADQY
jgi:tripartite ATP-independent transporter DctP family solute receptor